MDEDKKTIGRPRTHSMPGVAHAKQIPVFTLTTKRTEAGNLLSPEFNRKKGKDLYNFLINNTPAGVYRELIKLMIEDDIKCNNYFAKYLKIPLDQVQRLARKATDKQKLKAIIITTNNISDQDNQHLYYEQCVGKT